MRLEVICRHKRTKDDHTLGVNEALDVLETISKPDTGVIEVGLSRSGRDKGVGFVRYTIEVVKTHKLRKGTHQQTSLSWRTLNSADIICKVIFNDGVDDLVPPQWVCIVSSLDGLVKTTQDLAEVHTQSHFQDTDYMRSSSTHRPRSRLVRSVRRLKYVFVPAN